MNLAELKEAYKARKLALDSAKKEEEKYKALLKDAMLEAGESDYTDEAGYRFERIVQERKRMDAGVHSVIMSHIEEHSKKPAETRDRIVKLMAGGGLPKIELFARQCIDGWDCWGNEV